MLKPKPPKPPKPIMILSLPINCLSGPIQHHYYPCLSYATLVTGIQNTKLSSMLEGKSRFHVSRKYGLVYFGISPDVEVEVAKKMMDDEIVGFMLQKFGLNELTQKSDTN